ncbi:hypothetical protein FRB99_004983 [Tulasnella sp. 403]|nr:hypothetical protein FRB99_004983 [Tulasnella sp. 403]
MAVGQVSFHNDKRVKRVHVAQRENPIVNRLNKTKVEREVDHEQERIERQKAESAKRRVAAAEQRKAEQELAKTRAAEKAARSYDTLFTDVEEGPSSKKTVQEMEDDFIAIDNATRGLINLGQLPVTCGLFFSLGHSTIVIAVNIAIAISTSVYDKISNVSDVGGIIGASVSASFLFLIGLANSIILYRILKQRRRMARRRQAAERGEHVEGPGEEELTQQKTLMMRILGPVTRFVDRPWKVTPFPIGVLFGFGFDTASSIALLAVTALAKRGDDDRPRISNGDIVILPLLFTAGMTFVDSADSVLMLYSYAGVPEKGFAIFNRKRPIALQGDDVVGRDSVQSRSPSPRSPSLGGVPSITQQDPSSPVDDQDQDAVDKKAPALEDEVTVDVIRKSPDDDLEETTVEEQEAKLRVKQNTMSKLSIILTLISILVAFRSRASDPVNDR